MQQKYNTLRISPIKLLLLKPLIKLHLMKYDRSIGLLHDCSAGSCDSVDGIGSTTVCTCPDLECDSFLLVLVSFYIGLYKKKTALLGSSVLVDSLFLWLRQFLFINVLDPRVLLQESNSMLKKF